VTEALKPTGSRADRMVAALMLIRSGRLAS
jgi:hypothetical protein